MKPSAFDEQPLIRGGSSATISRDSTCEQVSATKYIFRLAAKGISLAALREFKVKILKEFNRNMAEPLVSQSITHPPL